MNLDRYLESCIHLRSRHEPAALVMANTGEFRLLHASAGYCMLVQVNTGWYRSMKVATSPMFINVYNSP